MNWFTLLKQPKLRVGNKVTTNLGSESESQDDDCERKVREYADKVGNYSQTGSNLHGHSSLDYENNSAKFSEEVYCKALSIINRIQPNDQINEYVETDGVPYDVEVTYFYYPGNEEAVFSVYIVGYNISSVGDDNIIYFELEFHNKLVGLSEEEALKKVDFR
tara:strand:- start:742 stop:1227 length:486 start_codon:yes stop_codon:yes gene_type:complete